MSKLILPDETFAIRGAIFEVYREKGCGFSEAVYQECLEFELQARGIPFVSKLGMIVSFGHFPGVEVERYIMQEGRFKRSAGGSTTNRSVGI